MKSQPRDTPYQLMWLLLVSPAQPTENKTHAECNDSVKEYDPEAPFHLQRITSELQKQEKRVQNVQYLVSALLSTYTNVQNSLKNESN